MRGARQIRIAGRPVGPGAPTFIIAEIGSNHNQDLALAREMIAAAAECGVDAVKFQSLDYQEIFAEDIPGYRELYEQIRLDESWYSELSETAARRGVLFFSSPCYLKAIALLEDAEVELYKIASPQTRSFPQLITAAARTGKPLIISTGYCGMPEIARAVQLCREAGNDQYCLLHCVSQYPARPETVQLAVMDSFAAEFDCPIGFSDHTLGIHVAVAAVARGAAVIEKHFTLDRRSPGPDHAFASEPGELRAMVTAIREVSAAIGSPVKVVLPEEESLAASLQHYRLVAARDLAAGEVIDGKLSYKRGGSGIAATEEPAALGRPLTRAVKSGALLQWSDLGGTP